MYSRNAWDLLNLYLLTEVRPRLAQDPGTQLSLTGKAAMQPACSQPMGVRIWVNSTQDHACEIG